MNLDKLFVVSAGVVAILLLSMSTTELKEMILRAQAKLIYESRTSTWGSPRFFKPANDDHSTKN